VVGVLEEMAMTTSATPVETMQASLKRFCAAWKTTDGVTLADCYVADGSLITPFGQRADGRSAVAAMYAALLAGPLQGTTTTISLARVRTVGTDHAFVDAEQAIIAPDGSVLVSAHLAALLRHEGDRWRFVDARPYTFVPLE
jgi:uncharacterized protein (TIGR02246 family)